MHKTTYWIKLYHEMLSDPKMGLLDNHTWRRTIEIFLIAGEHNRGGALPPIKLIAWRLHAEQDEILNVLLDLEKTGITSRDESGEWRVTNFAKRQGPSSSTERSRAFRNRRGACDDDRYADRENDDTNGSAPVSIPCPENAPDTDTDSELDTDSDPDNVCDSHTTDPDKNTPVSQIPTSMSPKESCETLTPGQTYFARAFKTQPNPAQLLTLAQLEKTHGYPRLTQVIDWAIRSGIPPGRATRAIRTAIKAWCEASPPNGRAGDLHRTGALEKLRRKYSDGLDS